MFLKQALSQENLAVLKRVLLRSSKYCVFLFCAMAVLANSPSGTAQEYIFPNRLFSDSGLIEYRPYTLEEARAIERGENNDPLDNPLLLDWGPERQLTSGQQPYAPKVIAAGDTLYCCYYTLNDGQPYFIKSSDDGTSWSQCLNLGDTSSTRAFFFPEMALNAQRIIIGSNFYEFGRHGYNLGYFKSSDGGNTWGSISILFGYYLFNQSNFSSFTNVGNRVYFAYNEYEHDSLYVLISSNWGTSWNGRGVSVAYLNGTPQNMCLRASGNYLHLVWVNEVPSVGIRYSRSTDGGQSWSGELDLAEDSLGSQRCYVAVEDSHVVVSWMGYRYSPAGFTGDMFIRQSYDNGATWDSAQALTDSHKVWMGSVYTKDSLIIVTWQDMRFDDGNNSETYARISTDNGINWTIEERLSYGDHDSDSPIAASTGNILHILWGDRRANYSGLYYRMYDPNYDAIDDKPPMPEEAAILSAYPNPFNSSTIIRYSINKESPIEIYNLLGQNIKTLQTQGKEGSVIWDGMDDKWNPVSSGVYFATIGSSGKIVCTKLVLLR